ncbi:uncharacterized protein METZ01_LOCUS60511 [marine metagenome]|uniref:AMP-dependent synthetase/ligase domain-containing protein n=1 Tax=marine metagenome TaxID=408172 RepID=A0A381SZ17_9ZZZZ
MNNPVWTPSQKQIDRSQMTKFIKYVNLSHHLSLKNYDDLYSWSIQDIPSFWESVWEFCEVKYSTPYSEIVDDTSKMPGAKWFTGSQLNYAENLLRFKDSKPAIIFKGENQNPSILTYHDLNEEVKKVAYALRNMGIVKGDRVAGFIPNMPEAVIAMLGAASIGAIWSSSSPDFGIKGVLDRFAQIEPKVLFAADGYFYNGKRFNSLDKLEGILKALPSIENVVIVPYTRHQADISSIQNGIHYKDFLPVGKVPEIIFEQLPFNHPLYIMYSSGTTGLPKSIVHGAGGTLIQHLKELCLHTDLTRDDTIIYFTTCGWMMWNWLVSSLAIGATIVLYDGSPFHPDSGAMWKMAQDFKITVFGTSAKFIASSQSIGEKPKEKYMLNELKTILSTGSPLIEENYDFVYENIKEDVQLSSISGGTDIISCFALGNPILPVHRGELQCRGLGMDVQSFDSDGNLVINKKGELVCASSFPSMPVYFWNDPDGTKYQQAYFNSYPGVWHHGDYIMINNLGGIKIFGRSDATLNPGGIRIGTAEIYRVVENFSEVTDSLVVGQKWGDDERVILFVKLTEGTSLHNKFIQKIKKTIRSECSPRHIPKKIIVIADIPYTINGKKVEIAVKKIIHGEDVPNRDALANPESLKFYQNLPDLQT